MHDKTSQLPAWLTKEYMQEKLSLFHKDQQLRVLKLSAESATGKGGNYVGVLTRLQVEFQTGDGQRQQQTYLLKETCSKDTPEAEIFKEYGVYTRELDMYENVLPKMSAILREFGIKDKRHPDAVCVDRDHAILILEDLGQLEYRNADRVQRLDVKHVQLALEMLAKYHAAAAALHQRQPEVFAKNYDCTFFSRGVKGYGTVFSGLFKALLRYIKTQPKLEARYYEKLSHMQDNLMEYGARCLDVGSEDFQTLTHGDCWTTNIMFRYNADGQPSAVIPIDFQFSHWTSPAIDLHYFFSTSLREEVGKRQTELVQHYYYALKGALEQLKYQGPFHSLYEFQLQFEKRRFFTVFITLAFQTIMIYNGKEETSFQNLYQDTPEAIRFQDSMYESEQAQRIVHRMLPIFDAKGLLDDLH
ncbi:uncharacterized protein LOC115620961 [Scaptodrosophila lebanonensis]|uniref:Uncharacterized protein LOC115620961 n=1 Tax=Drosophila lebanonensis TaxID=7225 RepID=A0A6J2T5X8_DROLE|nr:uncharacterized protein LOC115620961 [Scaptodrosophila lebanonensis]